jgi:hypothetical protein
MISRYNAKSDYTKYNKGYGMLLKNSFYFSKWNVERLSGIKCRNTLNGGECFLTALELRFVRTLLDWSIQYTAIETHSNVRPTSWIQDACTSTYTRIAYYTYLTVLSTSPSHASDQVSAKHRAATSVFTAVFWCSAVTTHFHIFDSVYISKHHL